MGKFEKRVAKALHKQDVEIRRDRFAGYASDLYSAGLMDGEQFLEVADKIRTHFDNQLNDNK